ncbi:MAG: peptide ABC transporter substrate-binding protein [Woeseiaceae bacterium]
MGNKARLGLLGAALAACVVIVIACSPDSSEAPATATVEKVLRRANIAEPATLDPHKAEGVSSNNVLRDLFEGLVTEAPDGTLVAGAAASWSIEQAGTVYRFTLRPTGRWSDGTSVTAADFVAGFQRTVSPETNSTYAALLSPIQNATAIIAGEKTVDLLGVNAIDDLTLEITLTQPTPYFLGLLLTPATYPLHRESFERLGADFVRPENLISNGPYKMISWRIGDRLSVGINPNYWNAEAVAIDRVEFLPLEDTSVELDLFRAGEVDITSSIPSSQYASIRKTYTDELSIKPLLGTYFLVFDTTQPPFDDVGLRKALSIAVDRERLADAVLGGANPGAWGYVPPGISGYDNYVYPWKGIPREAQLTMARELYAAAGYSQEKPLRIRMFYNTGDNHRKIMISVQEMLRENLGVNAEIINQEWKVMLQTRKDFSEWDIMRFGWNGDYQDANTFLEIFTRDNALNTAGWDSPRFDQLLADANRELDLAIRAEMLRKAESYILEDYPLLPLYYYASKHLVSSRITGFSATVMDRIYSQHLDIEVAQ